MKQIWLKYIALGLLIIPFGFLGLFTIGEIIDGDISGISHLLQASPIIIFAFLSWKKPLIGGPILAGISLILGVLYAFDGKLPIQTIILVELILFTPPLLSGILFILSSSKQ